MGIHLWLHQRLRRPRRGALARPVAVAALLGVLLAAGCKPAPEAGTQAASGPAAAVERLARRLHDNDLLGFARDAMPPEELARLEQAWREGRSRWPLTELPLDEQLLPMLSALSAPGAERDLQRAFSLHLAGQERDLKAAARTLGQFGIKYVRSEGGYSDEERAHYAQLIAALGAWAQQAPLADAQRAKAAIPRLAAAARSTGLGDETALRTAGLQDSLVRLAPFFAEMKTTLASYGLPLDASLAGLRASVLEQDGDRARVQVRYPLGSQTIDTVLSLERRDGRWYLADHLRHAAQALASEPESGPEIAARAPARLPADAAPAATPR